MVTPDDLNQDGRTAVRGVADERSAALADSIPIATADPERTSKGFTGVNVTLKALQVVLTRGIDLSVGSNLSLSAVVGAIVWRDHGSALLAVAATLATATVVGLINGLLYVKGRLPHPFIPTLAMLTAASGLALLLSHSETIQGAPPVVIVVVAIMALVTRGLVWGRWIYAVGGNPDAAVRNGIPVQGVLISVYV